MLPVMLDVRDRRCLVVGGGEIALRKALALVEEGAVVTVVAPDIVPELQRMAAAGRIEVEKRPYQVGEAKQFLLVYAATDDTTVNKQVSDDARLAGVWVNVADVPELCTFHVPGRVRRGGLDVAIASGGQAPFAVRRLRELLDSRLGSEWGDWLESARRFRVSAKARLADAASQDEAFDRFFAGTVDKQLLIARAPAEAEEQGWIDAAATRAEGTPRMGFVSLVGAGPGCAGLLTLRGRQRLFAADAVAYDRLAAPALPHDLPARIELHCVGKQAGHHPVPQDEINALLVRLGLEGKRVVRFKGGDPYVFGRGGEEVEALQAAGVPFEVIPGVTSGLAAPAWAGIPLTHRREAVRVTLVTAHESADADAPHMRWDLVAQDPHGTLVGYMGVTSLPHVVKSLIDAGMDPATPAAMVERGTTAAQKSVVAELATLQAAVERAGLHPPALFVIGPTVKHAPQLDWVAQLPLAGSRLIVGLEERFDLSEALTEAGADVVRVGSTVTPVGRVLMNVLPLTGWVTDSADHVKAMDAEREAQVWAPGATLWCLGEGVAREARARGWTRVEVLDARIDRADLVAAVSRAQTAELGRA